MKVLKALKMLIELNIKYKLGKKKEKNESKYK